MSKPQINDIDEIIAADAHSTAQQPQNPNNLLFIAEQKDYINQQTEVLKEELKDIQHYRDLRKKYADRVFVFMCIWCVFVFAILITDAITLHTLPCKYICFMYINRGNNDFCDWTCRIYDARSFPY